MIIKNIISFFAIIISLIFLMYTPSSAQEYYNQNLKFNTPLDFQRWAVLDDFNFDKINNWDLSAPAQQNSQVQTADSRQIVLPTYKKVTPGVPFNKIEGGRFLQKIYDSNPSCLGVKISFPELYKMDVILWPKESYKIDGVCKKISLWLLARNDDVDFFVVLKDYLNNYHYKFVTKLDFSGWRHFEVNVPSNIPQNYSPYPQKEAVEIVGFMVSNNPSRYADIAYRPVYFYIDQFEVLADQFYEPFYGIDITDNW